jgi:hypothetical protein
MVNFAHPANRNLLAYMAGREKGDRPRELNPADAEDPYYKLGTHPEIVERLLHHYPAYPELNVPASKFDLADFGPEWVFGGWLKGEDQWCRAAFDFASS